MVADGTSAATHLCFARLHSPSYAAASHTPAGGRRRGCTQSRSQPCRGRQKPGLQALPLLHSALLTWVSACQEAPAACSQLVVHKAAHCTELPEGSEVLWEEGRGQAGQWTRC